MPTAVRPRFAPAGPPEAAPAVRSLADRDAVAVLHRAAHAVRERLPALSDRLVAMLRTQDPYYGAGVVPDGDLRPRVYDSLAHNVGALLAPVETRTATRVYSWELATVRAGQGLPLASLLRAYRLGCRLVWDGMIEVTTAREPDNVHLLLHVAADMWNFVDEHCGVLAQAYRRAEQDLVGRHHERVRALLDALVAGTTAAADLPITAAALDLPVQGRYTMVAVTGGHRSALPEGMRTARRVGGAVDHVIVHLGDAAIGDLVAALEVGPHGRAGVGSVVDGLAAVGTARRPAEFALRVCAAGEVALLADHLPAALVASSPDLAGALVERALGAVLGLEQGDRDVLVATLETWLASGGSARHTGERIFCHRNTVLNRLRRYERLAGRSLEDPRTVVELSLALAALRPG